MIKQLLSIGVLAAATLTSQAAITWTGGGATDDFYDAANWDFSASTSIAILSPTDDDITISGATINEPSGSFTNIEIGDALSVTMSNTSFTFSNNNGFAGVDDLSDIASVLNLNNSSTLSAQFVTVGVTVNIDATSTLLIRGGGDGINSQTEPTIINLVGGSVLQLPNRAEFDEQVTAASGANTIFVNGTAVTVANMDTLFTFVGGVGTAVPEPSSAALLGLAGLALILRRRK